MSYNCIRCGRVHGPPLECDGCGSQHFAETECPNCKRQDAEVRRLKDTIEAMRRHGAVAGLDPAKHRNIKMAEVPLPIANIIKLLTRAMRLRNTMDAAMRRKDYTAALKYGGLHGTALNELQAFTNRLFEPGVET